MRHNQLCQRMNFYVIIVFIDESHMTTSLQPLWMNLRRLWTNTHIVLFMDEMYACKRMYSKEHSHRACCVTIVYVVLSLIQESVHLDLKINDYNYAKTFITYFLLSPLTQNC